MQAVTIHDAKTNLSKYIAQAKQGKTVLIGGYGKPQVKLVQVTQDDLPNQGKRDFSALQGKLADIDHAFSPETEQMISELMYGEHE